MHEHLVQFYDDDAIVLDSAVSFLARGLASGEACIVVATEEHRIQLDVRLRASGFNLDVAIERGQYVSLDAPSLLSLLMVGGALDFSKVEQIVWPIIAQAKRHYSRVHAFGEMVALLWDAGAHADAIALEKLWDELSGPHQLSLLCAYPRRMFRVDDDEALEQICAHHSQVIP